MYSEQDLTNAVAAGAISADAADALRRHVARQQSTRGADEEHVRLLTGFNDIFVTIAAAILLGALAWIGQSIWLPLAGALVAVAAWGLAEYFTRVRRMALPSIGLLLAFVGGVAASLIGVMVRYDEVWFGPHSSERIDAIIAAGIAITTAAAAYAHWRRFMVPITLAAGAAALVATVIALIAAAVGPENLGQNAILSLVLAGGLAIFVLAMHWDRSDTTRETRRSDVAFWLHLIAAPMIAHPLFTLLGITGDATIGVGAAFGVLALYTGFAFIALAIDRRAMLVSALAYVLYAMTELFRTFGAVELQFALTALVIGSALLLLSAFWQPARRMVLSLTPEGLRTMVPDAHLVAHSA